MQVIYADILFILNVYITYGLLLLTGYIAKSEIKRLRLLLSSVLSGFYSLIILVPDISDTVIALSRIPSCIVIVLAAYKVFNKRHFLRLVAVFLIVNFVFAGLMFALWYFLYPKNMYFNNGIVYFDINAVTLIVLTTVCYLSLKLLHKIIGAKVPLNTVYNLQIFVSEKVFSCRCFLDTGNSLKDVFTGYPIIVVSEEVLKDFLPLNIFDEKSLSCCEPKIRFIVCSTATKDGLLPSFKPEKVKISSLKGSFETDRVIVAVTKRKLKNGEFGAILPFDLFSNRTSERGELYAEKTVSH